MGSRDIMQAVSLRVSRDTGREYDTEGKVERGVEERRKPPVAIIATFQLSFNGPPFIVGIFLSW